MKEFESPTIPFIVRLPRNADRSTQQIHEDFRIPTCKVQSDCMLLHHSSFIVLALQHWEITNSNEQLPLHRTWSRFTFFNTFHSFFHHCSHQSHQLTTLIIKNTILDLLDLILQCSSHKRRVRFQKRTFKNAVFEVLMSVKQKVAYDESYPAQR